MKELVNKAIEFGNNLIKSGFEEEGFRVLRSAEDLHRNSQILNDSIKTVNHTIMSFKNLLDEKEKNTPV